MRRFHIWYDGLKEPWRELTCLSLFSIGIGAIVLGPVWHNPFLSFGVSFGGIFYILFLVVSRDRFLNEKAKSRGFKVCGRRL